MIDFLLALIGWFLIGVFITSIIIIGTYIFGLIFIFAAILTLLLAICLFTGLWLIGRW